MKIVFYEGKYECISHFPLNEHDQFHLGTVNSNGNE